MVYAWRPGFGVLFNLNPTGGGGGEGFYTPVVFGL